MTGDLTLTAALGIAITALASTVAVLWRTSEKRHEALEKRTESHLSVATEQMKILALLEVHMRGFQSSLERAGGDHSAQLATIEAKIDGRNELELIGHGAQMKVLATIEALLLQRQVEPTVDRRQRPGEAK